MTDEEMVAQVELLVGDARLSAFAGAYLDRAKAAIVERLWPYDEAATWADVPEKHHMLAVDIAVYLVNRRGAEGETQHSESGTNRSYENAGIPTSYLMGLTPHVGVPR